MLFRVLLPRCCSLEALLEEHFEKSACVGDPSVCVLRFSSNSQTKGHNANVIAAFPYVQGLQEEDMLYECGLLGYAGGGWGGEASPRRLRRKAFGYGKRGVHAELVQYVMEGGSCACANGVGQPRR